MNKHNDYSEIATSPHTPNNKKSHGSFNIECQQKLVGFPSILSHPINSDEKSSPTIRINLQQPDELLGQEWMTGKRGAPFKGSVHDQKSEKHIKEKRSVFRMFKNFFGKELYKSYFS